MRQRLLVCAAIVTFASASAHAAIPQRERDALLAVFNATSGPTWDSGAGWGGPPGTECNWYAVSCNEAQTTVTQLILGFNNLKGTIPAAVADLDNLEELNMAADSLSGPLPPELGRLTKLKLLQLPGNELSGTIPPALGSLTSLTDLELGSNTFTGAIPPELGRLAQLKILSLRINQLSGTIPSGLSQLGNLTSLELDGNSLSGSLPDLSMWTQLQTLQLNDNQLTGALPVSIGQLRSLQTLNLASNKFTGTIPKEIGSLAQLTGLSLYNNAFGGDIPAEVYSLTLLQRVDLSHNQFTGGLSSGVARLAALVLLELNANKLAGPIPAELTSLAKLDTLDLSANGFTGTIPTDIGRLPVLRYVDLGDNKLEGTIPSSIGSLANLEFLGLYQNQLTGSIPPQLASATRLRGIELFANQLTGPIPDSFRSLSNLEQLYLGYNQLSGPVPDFLFQLPKIDGIFLGNNAFTGTIPAAMTSSVTLTSVDLGSNQLNGTIPGDIGRMPKLAYLTLSDNELTGAIPDSMWDLKEMVDLRLGSLHLSGTLSPRVGALQKLIVFSVADNDLTGTIPAEIGTLSSMQYLSLGSDRFTGTIPRELGQLKNLIQLNLESNNLHGPIPSELSGLTKLDDSGSDFTYNSLFTSDPALATFINRVQSGHDFTSTQTITPTNLKVTQTTDRSALVEWTPIEYLFDEGGYQVRASLTPGGSTVAIATTSSKEINTVTVRGLQPSTTYFFNVSSVTHPHDFQRNVVISDPSGSVSAATGVRVLAPPEVVVTATPTGLVQIDRVPQNEDSFTLTNFGDVATTITLNKSDDDFFAISPDTFTLGAGASQTIKVTSLPKEPGVFYGYAFPTGTGTSEDNIVTITLLSAARVGGNAIAEALTSRVEVFGGAGTDSVGTVTFRNRGTATLTGIVVADVPWIVPNSDPITIEPQSQVLVRFKVIRARRPPGLADGTLTGTLSLIYVGALPNNSVVHIDDTTPPAGISITKVTVVDVSKPDVAPSTPPPLAQGEVAYFIAGLASKGGASSLASDLHIGNAFGSKSVDDVRLYYTAAASTQSFVAGLGSLVPGLAVTLANIMTNVYGVSDQVGTIQVRSRDWQSLTINATLLRLVSGVGTYAGEVPVFRSDRALRVNDKMFVTGIRQTQNVHATLYLQEIAGTAATVRLDFLDSAGTVTTRNVPLAALAISEITDVPTSTMTVTITNATTAAPTGVIAYARMSDDASGDIWSVVDWSRLLDYSRSQPVRLPLVEGGGPSSGKRRAVKHSSGAESEAVAPRAATSIAIFNSGTVEARAKLTYGNASREVTIPTRQTLSIPDVSSFLGSTSTSQSLVVEPLRGEVVATSRSSAPNASGGSFGTAIPVVSALTGLRVGQGQTFSGLEDSAGSTVAAGTPGTFRTDYGFVETGGAATTVRATLLIPGVKFTAFVTRDFTLQSGQSILVRDLVKSIIGSTRETQYRDLHDLKLQLDITAGSGSILPFVIVTDNGTSDSVLRLQ